MGKFWLWLGFSQNAQVRTADNSCNSVFLSEIYATADILSLTLACLTSQRFAACKTCAQCVPACLTKRTCVVQVVLQSLEIYNDVQGSAVPALTAHHLAAEAQADAKVCMRKLINNLATEVKNCIHQAYAVLLHKDQGNVCMH